MTKEITGLKLRLEYDGGIVSGKQKIVSKQYGNISKTVQDSDLHSVGKELSKLCDKTILEVKRVEITRLKWIIRIIKRRV